MTEHLFVVDLETTGLGAAAAILEVAVVNVWTDDEVYFVPYVTPAAFGAAEPQAMAINRYYERRVFENALGFEETLNMFAGLQTALIGQTFGGSNPAFDATILARQQVAAPAIADSAVFGLPMGAVWHHRLADLSAYAAGVLGLSLTELPGLSTVCELLDIRNEDPHSALGDARAAANCFRVLTRRSGVAS